MKEKIIMVIAIMAIATISACAKSDPESDFNVEPLDGGKSVVITGYAGTKWDVRIPPRIRNLPVTHIGDRAFHEKNLISITIPNGVTTIGNQAFYGNQLTSITIPNSVTSIGASAFQNNKLTSIIIPDGVTSIEAQAFIDNPLDSIIIPASVTEITRYWEWMEWIRDGFGRFAEGPFPDMPDEMFIITFEANGLVLQ